MKSQFTNLLSLLFAVVFCLAATTSARAGLSLQLDVIHNVTAHVYTLAPNLSTNGNAPDSTPITYHEVSSPNTNSSGLPNFTGGVGTGHGETRDDFPDSDFNGFIHAVTNGPWKLVMNVGDPSQHTYTFTVSSTMASNLLVATVIDYPPDGATNIAPLPTFAWHGPTNADSLFVYVISPDASLFQYAFPDALTTNITLPPPLTNGDYTFIADYTKDVSAFIASTIPRDVSNNPATGWVSTAASDDGNQSAFSVLIPPPPPLPTGHTNIAHYAFDGGQLGLDSSANGNDINAGTGWGPGTPVHALTTDAVAGGGAVQFFGFTSLVPLNQTFDNLSNALTGSFSVSAWIKTTNFLGNDGDDLSGNTGQSVVDFSFDGIGTTPLGLTGSKLAFLTIDPDGHADTLHSTISVPSGQYVHVVTTRDQTTGLKSIYINGVLDSSNTASTELLTGNGFALLGGYQGSPYTGLLDDLQIYTGVLDAADVSYLHANPGSVVPNAGPNSSDAQLAAAVDATNQFWASSGDAAWFAETNITYDGVSAVQSGSLLDSQTSVLQTTVVGPGTVSFFWQTMANDDSFNLEFDVNGQPQADINFTTPWEQQTFNVGSGTNVLTWTASTVNDTGSDPSDAGFVDQFVFTSGQAPVITLNPFDQTNYPGYGVCLVANATGTPPPTWQWYKNTQPVSGATNALFIPADSGSNSVIGNYYAVASNSSGPAITTTAAVSFATGTLPPDWSLSFKSDFVIYDDSSLFFDTLKDYYYNCVLDSTGNIYVAAEFSNTNIFNTNSAVFDTDVLVPGSGGNAGAIVKQSPTGDGIWVQTITNNGNGHAAALAVATAPGDGVYAAGNFTGTNFLGANQLVDSGVGSIFVARFAANGSNVWVKTLLTSSTEFVQINSLVSDPSGNVTFIASVTNSGVVTASLIQLDSTGAFRWSQPLPADTRNLAYSAGRLYAGVYNPAGSVAIGSLNYVTDRRWTLAAFSNTNGQPLWLRGVGAPLAAGSANGLLDDAPCVAASGANVFIVGRAYGSGASFGSFTVSWPDSAGDYVARYDTNGTPQLATSFGSATTTPIAVVAMPSGGFYVSGDFDTFSRFGQDLIAAPNFGPTPIGNPDQAFVARFDSNGNSVWARLAQATIDARQSSYVNSFGIALAPDGVWTSTVFRPRVKFGGNIFNGNPLYFDFNLIFDDYDAGALAKITESVVPVLPVTIINTQRAGANRQFSFVSTAGHTNIVQSTTNLATHSWQTYTNVIGDGTLKTIQAPASTPGQTFFRVDTQ